MRRTISFVTVALVVAAMILASALHARPAELRLRPNRRTRRHRDQELGHRRLSLRPQPCARPAHRHQQCHLPGSGRGRAGNPARRSRGEAIRLPDRRRVRPGASRSGRAATVVSRRIARSRRCGAEQWARRRWLARPAVERARPGSGSGISSRATSSRLAWARSMAPGSPGRPFLRSPTRSSRAWPSGRTARSTRSTR